VHVCFVGALPWTPGSLETYLALGCWKVRLFFEDSYLVSFGAADWFVLGVRSAG
jgi:hypothetical protein